MSNSDFKTRIIVISVMFLSVFACLGSRFYFVQIQRHDELYSKAKAIYTRVKNETGKRGEIYDYNGSLLAGNIPCTNIIADPQLTGDEKECEATALMLAEKLQVPGGLLFQKLSTKERNGKELRYALLQREVSLETAELIKQEVREKGHKGLFFQENTKRFYPKGPLLAQTLGFVNVDRDKAIPVAGVEKATNQEVSSGGGKIKTERDRKGRSLSYGYTEIDESKNGKNVFLTIDEQIQTIVEEELDKLYAKYKPKAAYAIMVDPRTGNILAMAQRPTFNPNDRSTMSPESWRNRMTTDVFEPGSTMKPIVIGSALDYNVVNPDTVFDCENGYWKDMRLRDSHRMQEATVIRILAESSNIGTAKVSVEMGKVLLYKALKRFGFAEKTGIPLKPEATGILRKPHQWDYLSISRFPIGQGVSVSPMQLVRAYCGIASGRLVSLRLIDRIQDAETGDIQVQPLVPAPRVYLNPASRKQLIEMMKLVTQEGGTAIRAAIPGYEVAGKTGTSQKWIPGDKEKRTKGYYSEKDFFATFIGFVPADDPAFVLAVIADEPQGNHFGGVVSAPTFNEIAKKTLAYMNVLPKYPEEIVAKTEKE